MHTFLIILLCIGCLAIGAGLMFWWLCWAFMRNLYR